MKHTCKSFATIVFVFLAGLAACKKDMETTVNGKIIDRTTQNPIAQAKICLLAGSTSGGFFSGTGNIIDSVYSQSDGVFSFNFEADENMSYSIYGRKVKYMEMYGNPNPAVDAPLGIEKGEKNTPTLMLTPFAYLKIVLNNITKSDEISIGDPCVSINCSITGPLTNYVVGIFGVKGNTNAKLFWAVYNDGKEETFRDTIYCSAFDTTEFNINY